MEHIKKGYTANDNLAVAEMVRYAISKMPVRPNQNSHANRS